MLDISLLGPFAARVKERPLTQLTAQKAQALLIYLAVEARQVHQRDALMTLLWPDYPQKSAQQSLRQTLYLLRQALESKETNTPLILSEQKTIRLNPDATIAIDVVQFEQLSGNGRTPQEWQQAVDLYRGDFLSDFYLPDSEPFEEWAAGRRAFYQRRMHELLQRLVDHYLEVGDYAAAETAVRRQLTLDNLQEAAHRQLMETLARNGRRQEALSHYNNLQQLLQDELGIEPEADTIALIEAIRAGELAERSSVLISPTKQPPPPRHNLPHRLTSFIGREKELGEIADLLTNNRLVMLTGVGGIGKTTLSIQVGLTMLESFVDGVWLVELAAVMDGALVPHTVLYGLNLSESSNRPVLERLLEFLREKECLLILDNCEHVVQAAAQFVKIALQSCSKLKILATSREIFDIPGERPFYLSSLSMPADQQLAALAQWPQYEAMRLFADRATTILPEYQVTQDNLAPLVQICQQLDGIPLALELAAARVKTLTTAQIASGLDQRFRLLTSGNRTALPRQQTLRALVDWSWELLTLGEQALLRRLAVFAGSITLGAVTAVCTDDDVNEFEVLDLLTQLVNKSIIIAERKPGQETRYRLLETIRQYGQERLAETGEAHKFRQRHLDYFVQLGEQAEQALVGPDQVAWLNRLEGELDNIRAALNWANETETEKGLRLAVGIWKFWEARYVHEGEKWLEQLLIQAQRVEPAIRAKALSVQGALSTNLFDNNRACNILKSSLSLFQSVENEEGIAFCLHFLAMGSAQLNDNDITWNYLTESHTLYRGLADKLGIADTLLTMGYFALNNLNNYQQARIYLEESHSLFRELRHLAGIASVLNTLGGLALLQGDYEAARLCLEESQVHIQILEGKKVGGGILADFGELYFRLEDYEKARSYLENSISIGQQNGETLRLYWARVRLGYVHLRISQLEQAQAIFIESQQKFHSVDSIIGVIFATEGLASLAVRWEQADLAAQLLGWADAAREALQHLRPPAEQADVDRETQTILQMVGEEAYAAAYAIGQTMTMEEAIALAVGDKGFAS